MAPLHVIDYVVVHELCHLKVMNHSKDFWNLVESILPNYHESRKWLKVNGNRLGIQFYRVKGKRVKEFKISFLQIAQSISVSGDFETRLRKLNRLKEDGLITEEEFQKKREEILREKWQKNKAVDTGFCLMG